MCLSISFSKIHPSKWIVVSHHWTRIRDYFSPFLAHVLVFCISNEGKDDKDSFEVGSVRKQKEIHIKLINDKDSSNETQRNDDSKFTRAQALMLWCDKRFLHNFSPTCKNDIVLKKLSCLTAGKTTNYNKTFEENEWFNQSHCAVQPHSMWQSLFLWKRNTNDIGKVDELMILSTPST